MRTGKLLLLLAAVVHLARSQQKPEVSVTPKKLFYNGDIIYLSCINIPTTDSVKWYFNDSLKLENKIWKIVGASPNNSGRYQCESSGQKSDHLFINVLACLPRASLIIKTGQPVMRPGGSVILQLENNDGLQGWKCWVLREQEKKRIKLKVNNESNSLTFQPKQLLVAETIFWCTDRDEDTRSDQIIVRTSDKDVSMEMYPLPAVAGQSLVLRCLVWGTDQITETVFYKDGKQIDRAHKTSHKVTNVTESVRGNYYCDAKYTYKARTDGPPYQMASDSQHLFVKGPLMQAFISENVGLSCSCPGCPSDVSYHWSYKTDDQQPWESVKSSQEFMMPKERGTYVCYGLWAQGRSLPSRSYVYKPPIQVILILVGVILLVILCLAATIFYVCYKRRNSTGPVYEDVGLRSFDKGDDKYEKLRKPTGAQREGEYDTLHPEAAGQEKKEGDYQKLKREGTTEGVYHTLGMEGAGGGAGGYEPLKKEGRAEGVYHTLGTEGAGGGAGGYEALKKEGRAEGVYHTLGTEGAGGGAGGYEALKKEGRAEGVYHTLGTEGAGGGVVGKDEDTKIEILEEKI